MLTKDQEKHLNKIIIKTSERQIHKYNLGAAEHGGNLWDMPVEQLADEALNEVVDLGAYLTTLIENLQELLRENEELRHSLQQLLQENKELKQKLIQSDTGYTPQQSQDRTFGSIAES